MESILIARRFVRIKALQNLYAYTIAQQAHQKEAIEQIKRDFMFDRWLSAREEPLAKEQSIAVALFCQTVAAQLAADAFAYGENNQIEQSVRSHLFHYEQALGQDQMLLHRGFNQSKESIYRDYLYILLLLVEWYKLAKKSMGPSQPTDHLLKNQLAQHPLLKELYKNSNWINAINKQGVSWAQAQNRVETWYAQWIQSVEMPKALVHLLNPNNSVKFLEYIVQSVIFKNEEIRDFFSMVDLYWDEHKRMVKKILTRTFMMVATKDFNGFTLFWHNLEAKWAVEAAFYNRLLQITIQNSHTYEAMIGEKTEKWDSERMVLIDKLILKLALAELLNFEEIPIKASINEYIEIAKWYGTAKNSQFVNGVLEGILKGLNRPQENGK